VVDGVQAVFFWVEHGGPGKILIKTVLTKGMIFFIQIKRCVTVKFL
jgi:hypothetical protein